jgi:glycerol-3-phosphate acyltransferase PlsY
MTLSGWAVPVSLTGAYLIGSFPTGFLIVRAFTGKDLRTEHSGRTGGTNAFRSAGMIAGLVTGLGDLLKGALAVLFVREITGGTAWMDAAAGILAVVGHNYSIFLLERIGRTTRFRGGAGGAPTVGVAMALWGPSILIVLPVSGLVLLVIGYASLATLATGLVSLGIFLWRALAGLGPWEYVIAGIAVQVVLILSLRPNIERLIQGTERLVGWRARLRDRPKGRAAEAGDRERG